MVVSFTWKSGITPMLANSSRMKRTSYFSLRPSQSAAAWLYRGIEHLAVHHVNQERIRVITLRHDDISDRFLSPRPDKSISSLHVKSSTALTLNGASLTAAVIRMDCAVFRSLFEDIILFQTNVILIIGTYLIKNLIQLGGSCLWVCFA